MVVISVLSLVKVQARGILLIRAKVNVAWCRPRDAKPIVQFNKKFLYLKTTLMLVPY